MLLTVLLIVAGLVVLFLVVAALQPDIRVVERSVVIHAPASAPFVYLNNLRRWQEVSPYVKLDPAARYTWSGPVSGPGASLAWVGNRNLGEGRLTISESQPNERVGMRLEFVRPFKCNNAVEFTFTPQGDDTKVTWQLTDQTTFLSKAMGLVINMDKMIGRQFEDGLAQIKARSEADAAAITSHRNPA